MSANRLHATPRTNQLTVLILLGTLSCLSPANADQYLDYGIKLLKSREYATARQYFDRRLKLAPQDPKAYYYKALTYHYAGDRTQAKALYAQILDLFPDSHEATMAADNIEKMQVIEDANNKSLTDEERAERKIELKAARLEGEKTRQEQALGAAKKAYQDRIAPLQQKKEAILKEARAQADQILNDAKRKVEQFNGESEQLSRSGFRNARRRSQREQIMNDATEQADSIVSVAQTRADGIQIPPEPDWSKFSLPRK